MDHGDHNFKNKIRIFKIDPELFRKTVLPNTIVVNLGIRVEHVVRLGKTYNPKGIVYVEMLDECFPELVCFESFCRYYLGYKGSKPCS